MPIEPSQPGYKEEFSAPFADLTLEEIEQQDNASIQRALKRLKDYVTAERSHCMYHNSHYSHRSRSW